MLNDPRPTRACVDSPRHHAWFPNNVARNSLVNISGFENVSLELQRLWGVLKTDRRELHATFVWTRPAYAAGELGAGPETR